MKGVKILPFLLFFLSQGVNMKTLFLIPLLLLLSSCQVGKTGRMKLDNDITATFEACTIVPGYDYYYIGPDAQPDVILAVKKEYTITKGLWKATALDQQKLCDWIRTIDPDTRGGRSEYDGYVISSAAGKDVGLWYARNWADWTTIKEDNGTLIIYTPISPNSKLRPFKHDRDY